MAQEISGNEKGRFEFSRQKYFFLLSQTCIFWQFPTICVLLKVPCLVILFDRNLQVFENVKIAFQFLNFGIFHQFLSF